ncbi:MAG TPA: hypothetical protein VGR52_11690 [Stellaceae bacterium]|nr:hypothetical protein [Stellaceae bacterium]
MSATPTGIRSGRRLSPYVVLLIAVWTAIMTARLYPQFDRTLRIDGRITTVDDYIADRCDARLGPEVANCLATAHDKARTQLRREQARTVLIIAAPGVLYLLYLAPAALAGARRRRAAKRNKDTR